MTTNVLAFYAFVVFAFIVAFVLRTNYTDIHTCAADRTAYTQAAFGEYE